MTNTIVGEIRAAPTVMPRRPTVLILLGSYLPGYKGGGPIRSIENLVATFGDDVQFRIITLDRDLGEKRPYDGITANLWVRVGQADVMYVRPGPRGLRDVWALLRSVDQDTVLYLNSFFGRRFSMLAVLMRWLKLCRPRCLVLAPRGEFSPGALQFKHVRKSLYIRSSQWLGLYRGLVWHASSDFEKADIQRQFPLAKRIAIAEVIPASGGSTGNSPTSTIVIASDLAGFSVPKRREGQPKKPGQLRVVFVSRVSRKKNLAGALRMLDNLVGEVAFDIYGPAEDAEHWKECLDLIAALPANIQVRYCGQIEHSKITQVFADHQLFLFPTLGENYGHVICEALTAGCPVLVSDQTPWRNLEAEGVGWDIPLDDTERFRSVLQKCVDSGDEWFSALSKRAMEYADKRACDPEIVDANRRLFKEAFAWPNSSRAITER